MISSPHHCRRRIDYNTLTSYIDSVSFAGLSSTPTGLNVCAAFRRDLILSLLVHTRGTFPDRERIYSAGHRLIKWYMLNSICKRGRRTSIFSTLQQ